jgi:hypothetical protein
MKTDFGVGLCETVYGRMRNLHCRESFRLLRTFTRLKWLELRLFRFVLPRQETSQIPRTWLFPGLQIAPTLNRPSLQILPQTHSSDLVVPLLKDSARSLSLASQNTPTTPARPSALQQHKL